MSQLDAIYAFINPTTFYDIPQHILVGWKHTAANMQEVSRIKNVTITHL